MGKKGLPIWCDNYRSLSVSGNWSASLCRLSVARVKAVFLMEAMVIGVLLARARLVRVSRWLV